MIQHNPDKARPGQRRAGGFTLVELLLVMAVIVMLVGFTVANMGDLGSSRHLANGGSLVREMLDQARQLARSHNSMTMFVALTKGPDAYRCFTILERKTGETAWTQTAKWERLPEGIVLDKQKSALFVGTAASSSPPRPVLKQLGEDVQSTDYAFKIFLPGGHLLSGDVTPPVLYFKRSMEENPRNFYKIVINPNTGIAIARRP